MTNQVPYADIVDKETDGENAALLINDTKRAINELIVDTDASFKSFDSLTRAIAFVTANPDTIERLSTASYRDEAECAGLSIPYPDGGGADYVVEDNDGKAIIDGVWPAGSKQLKLTNSGNINVKAFGAGAGDSFIPLFNAIHCANSRSTGISVRSGLYLTSAALPILNNMVVTGDGREVTEIRRDSVSINDEIFKKEDPALLYDSLSITGVTISGDRLNQPTPVEGSLVSGRNISNVLIKDCGIKEGRHFGVNFNICKNVTIVNNTFSNVYRDMCGVWNTTTALIDGNIFQHNDDDCISINTAGFDVNDENGLHNVVITNNTLEDTGGIRTQQCRSLDVSTNIIARSKSSEAGVFIGSIPASGSRLANPINIKVHDNIITDKIDSDIRNALSGSVNNRSGIKLEGTTAIAGALSAAPHEVDPATGRAVTPYGYNYSTSGILNDQPIGRMVGVSIKNNKVVRTLPAVTNYSDWGFGEMFVRFTPTGYLDPEVTETLLALIPLQIEGPCKQLKVSNNYFAGSGVNSIRFKKLTEAAATLDNDLSDVEISDNELLDASSSGIVFTSYSPTTQDIVIKNNTINPDNFIKSTSRVESVGVATGGWVSQTSVIGVDYTGINGIILKSNTYKNCSLPSRNGGTGVAQVSDETLVCEPTVSGFSTSNLGVGTIPSNSITYNITHTASAPALANYGEILSVAELQTSGNTPPSSGFYLFGQFVTSRGIVPEIRNGQNQAIHGFKRLTTGDSHVDGVDWQAVWFEI